MIDDLDDLARELREARDHVMKVLVACSGYVDVRAAEGDPRAVHLAGLVASAHDRLTAANMLGATAVYEGTTTNG